MMDSLDKSQLGTSQVKNLCGTWVVVSLVVTGIMSIIGFCTLASSLEFTSPPHLGSGAPSTIVTQDRFNKKCGQTGLVFSNTNSQTHYFRDNKEVGKILIITGTVHHSYNEPHSFIKLRGVLSGAGGEVLADRFIYAGNILTERELAALPIIEIQSFLNGRSGQGGLNTNIQPNTEIPFMVVFDKIPQGMEGYHIDSAGSYLAEPEQHQGKE